MNNPILMVDPNGMAADSTKAVSPTQQDPKTILLAQLNVLGDAPKMKPFIGFWDQLGYFMTGGNYGRYHYNMNGIPTGLAPTMGMPPNLGMSNPLSFLKSLKNITSIVKRDTKILKLAEETFKGNDILRQ